MRKAGPCPLPGTTHSDESSTQRGKIVFWSVVTNNTFIFRHKTSMRSMRNELLMLTFNSLSYHSGLGQASINYCLFEGADLYSSIYMLVCFSTRVLRCFVEKFLVINVNFQCFWIDYSLLGSLRFSPLKFVCILCFQNVVSHEQVGTMTQNHLV